MIHNPLLEELCAELGYNWDKISPSKERELEGIIAAHDKYEEGYNDGYKGASQLHEDDYDDGKLDAYNDLLDEISKEIGKVMDKNRMDFLNQMWGYIYLKRNTREL